MTEPKAAFALLLAGGILILFQGIIY